MAGLLEVLNELTERVLKVVVTEDQQLVEDLAPGCPPPMWACRAPWWRSEPDIER